MNWAGSGTPRTHGYCKSEVTDTLCRGEKTGRAAAHAAGIGKLLVLKNKKAAIKPPRFQDLAILPTASFIRPTGLVKENLQAQPGKLTESSYLTPLRGHIRPDISPV